MYLSDRNSPAMGLQKYEMMPGGQNIYEENAN